MDNAAPNQNMQRNAQDDRINNISTSVTDIFNMLWRYKFVILVCAVILGAAFFVKTYFFTADTFTATGQLCVSNRSESYTKDDNGVILKSDLDTAQSLTTTYIELLKMREFLDEVNEQTDSKIGWRSIGRMVSISAKEKTEILTVSATADSPELAFDIADKFVTLAPDRLQDVYAGGNARVVNKVYMPTSPNGKGTVKQTGIGVLFGIVLGCAYAFLCTLFDRVIHHSADITKRFGLIILGEIADMAENGGKKAYGKKSYSRKYGETPDNDTAGGDKGEKTEGSAKTRFNILSADSSFDTIETYKSIRTNIMFSIPKTEKGKIIVVCSSAPSEGKTTTSVNLATTFAQTGNKVLLVDCDLRKPQLHHYLDIERGDGVSNILCGFTDLAGALRKNIRKNLDVLTAGKTPPNPAELLDTVEFGKLLEQIQEEYDYIFIDTPPITVVTDAMLTMQYCQGVVIVARENQTTFDLLDETVENIKRSGANVLGCIVSNASEKNTKYGYYRHGRYGYYRRSYYSYDSKIQVKNDATKNG